MPKFAIAKKTPVDNIKTVWAKEIDFSDWLITQEGIDLLADDCGIMIENAKREAKGANFSCDVVANLVGDEKHVVVIENQFGRTNHDHLAKLLTYAAAHKAMTGIWISEEAADDHRQVIDWLNENTPNTVALYLAELKAYTIGDSGAAPQLDLICRPNVTMKQSIVELSESDKKKREWRIAFWKDIHQQIKNIKPSFRLQKPGPGHWSSIAIGRSGFHIDMCLTPKNQSIVLEMIIQPIGWKGSAYDQLKEQQHEIETKIGKQLQWKPMPEKSCSKITLEEKLDPSIDINRTKVCEWFKEWTPIVFATFQERVKKLIQPDGTAETEISNSNE